MLQIARTVVGYHGCDGAFAHELLLGGAEVIADWRPSANDYDWLGRGIYFWEDGGPRAWRWAREQAAKKGWSRPGVVGAIIRLGRCFDLLDEQYTQMLRSAYEVVAADSISRQSPCRRTASGPISSCETSIA
ncbi:MAG TPA: hypothetical protein VHE35_17535 [Kofleriaceae bacterium]|nr:hypothetical protein [Kofleriaceae bacterium]